MPSVKWIKLQVDIFDNRKIKQIRAMPSGSDILLMWFQLMCLAGTINDDGKIYITPEIPFTEKTLATEFGLPIDTVKLGLTVFQEFGMIDIVDNFLMLSSWSKYQSVDGMEKIREQGRVRSAKFREKKRQELQGNVTRNVTVTQSNALEEEEEKERDCCSYNKDLINTRAREGKTQGKDNNNDNGRAVRDYQDRINPDASLLSIQAILDFERELGADVCIRAFDIALDEKKTNWSYIRAVLQNWKDRGVRCVADLEDLEAKRQKATKPKRRTKKKYKTVQDEDGNWIDVEVDGEDE